MEIAGHGSLARDARLPNDSPPDAVSLDGMRHEPAGSSRTRFAAGRPGIL
ncbi:hypothetical protein [Saccharopolyspora shandongensis]